MKVKLEIAADRNDTLTLDELSTFIDYAERVDLPLFYRPKVTTRPGGGVQKITVERLR